MTGMSGPLSSDTLLAEAGVAARTDEERIGAGTRHVPPNRCSDETLRGWGDAALLRLEWRSHVTYPLALHQEYRQGYAAAFQRARAIRTAQWLAATQRP